MTRDRSTSARERLRLSREQVERFERDGFLFPIDVFDADMLPRVRASVDSVRARLGELRDRLYEVEQAWSERPDDVVCHFLGGWRVDALLAEIVSLPQITVPLAQLLGVERLRFWHDQVFYKPPRHPGVVPWHQDYAYWTRTTPANHITINVMLDDADEDNGCLMFVPGSHRWGLLPKLPFDSDLDAIHAHLDERQRGAFRPVAAVLRAGQASIHHSHTLHGSHGNRSDRPRRALVLNYMGPETRVADDSVPLLAGVPHLPVGAVVDGEHFPIVLEPEPGTP